jgi:hypothetical protein
MDPAAVLNYYACRHVENETTCMYFRSTYTVEKPGVPQEHNM